MLTTAPSPSTAAAMAKPRSRPLTCRTTGAGATGARAAAGAAAGAGRAPGAPAAVGGRAAVGAPVDVDKRAPGAADGAGADPGAPAGRVAGVAEGGPPAGRVGNFMVGAEVGFGGKLMRTVSFFGCTLPVSAFLGGVGGTGGVPGLGLGMFSAISSFSLSEAMTHSAGCQTLFRFQKPHSAE